MKITLEPGRCVGAGHCVLSAPEVFDQDESDGVVILLDTEPDAALADAVHEAADLCPARAILVGGEDGTP
ncbi:ferredoxin [Streptomyces sp. IMTB 2501]|uniref:ferredoxin n=1 Tax=Streptomyces sp. IMTB 2501 TaxID=1776340 RepID=UPI0009A22845|nr:ferredoxin [Streptomyces sp. IMTB 2501]